jgi:hypothetical protein
MRLLAMLLVTSMPLLYVFTRRQTGHIFEQLSAPFMLLAGAGVFISVVGFVRLSARLLKARCEQQG